jgi:hypothetical protein
VEAFKFWPEKRADCPKTGQNRQNRRGPLDKLAPFFGPLLYRVAFVQYDVFYPILEWCIKNQWITFARVDVPHLLLRRDNSFFTKRRSDFALDNVHVVIEQFFVLPMLACGPAVEVAIATSSLPSPFTVCVRCFGKRSSF